VEENESTLVDILGITKDEDGNLVLIIDGVECRLPGAIASATLVENHQVAINVSANFYAKAVDVSGYTVGS
jgi:hypothetical protein